jgi:chromosome segregation ATPase
MFNPALIVAGVMVVGGSFGLGYHQRGQVESGKCANRLIDEMQTASNVLDRKSGELDQCRGQVEKFNASVSEQSRLLQAELKKNREASKRAAEAAANREKRFELSRAATAEALDALRSAIDDKDFGPCAGEPASDDLIGLLNDAIAASEGGDSSGRNSDLPPADSDD